MTDNLPSKLPKTDRYRDAEKVRVLLNSYKLDVEKMVDRVFYYELKFWALNSQNKQIDLSEAFQRKNDVARQLRHATAMELYKKLLTTNVKFFHITDPKDLSAFLYDLGSNFYCIEKLMDVGQKQEFVLKKDGLSEQSLGYLRPYQEVTAKLMAVQEIDFNLGQMSVVLQDEGRACSFVQFLDILTSQKLIFDGKHYVFDNKMYLKDSKISLGRDEPRVLKEGLQKNVRLVGETTSDAIPIVQIDEIFQPSQENAENVIDEMKMASKKPTLSRISSQISASRNKITFNEFKEKLHFVRNEECAKNQYSGDYKKTTGNTITLISEEDTTANKRPNQKNNSNKNSQTTTQRRQTMPINTHSLQPKRKSMNKMDALSKQPRILENTSAGSSLNKIKNIQKITSSPITALTVLKKLNKSKEVSPLAKMNSHMSTIPSSLSISTPSSLSTIITTTVPLLPTKQILSTGKVDKPPYPLPIPPFIRDIPPPPILRLLPSRPMRPSNANTPFLVNLLASSPTICYPPFIPPTIMPMTLPQQTYGTCSPEAAYFYPGFFPYPWLPPVSPAIPIPTTSSTKFCNQSRPQH